MSTESRDPRFTELDRLIAAEKADRPRRLERSRRLRMAFHLPAAGRPVGRSRRRYGFAARDRLIEEDERVAALERLRQQVTGETARERRPSGKEGT
jgi:hypothetical protein